MNTENDKAVPKALKIWFIIHFIVDISFALPLFLFPEGFMKLLGWTVIDPITARMAAAALFGIGGESLLCIKLGRDAFKAMLNLKIIWSIAAITGFTIALIKGAFGYPFIGAGLLAVFVIFSGIWIFWRKRI